MLPNIHRDDDGKRRRRGSGVVVAVRTGRRDGGSICSKLSELLGHEMSKAKMLQSFDLYYCGMQRLGWERRRRRRRRRQLKPTSEE